MCSEIALVTLKKILSQKRLLVDVTEGRVPPVLAGLQVA
jgi:hypothetical protein